MATATLNLDGTFTLTLTSAESTTMELLADGEFAAYVTQWLADKQPRVLGGRVSLLSEADRDDVLSKLKSAKQRH